MSQAEASFAPLIHEMTRVFQQFDEFQFSVQFQTHEKACHPERSETESKDLRTDSTAARNEIRRFFDSLMLAQNDTAGGCVTAR